MCIVGCKGPSGGVPGRLAVFRFPISGKLRERLLEERSDFLVCGIGRRYGGVVLFFGFQRGPRMCAGTLFGCGADGLRYELSAEGRTICRCILFGAARPLAAKADAAVSFCGRVRR